MNTNRTIDGILLAQMMQAGCENLRTHVEEINDLNVFPIPDGDTGDNMLLTLIGGAEAVGSGEKNIGETARLAADAMLLSARGNSGVILSQICEGIADGLADASEADCEMLCRAIRKGAEKAYDTVMHPTEGTMLTVVRHLSEKSEKASDISPAELISYWHSEANAILQKTPEMLPVLKKAGVVDSGGAGLVCILEGMLNVWDGDGVKSADGVNNSYLISAEKKPKLQLDSFTSDSVLEFGYCTELLLRLMNAKCDPETFDAQAFAQSLRDIGDSIVATKSGSILKLHIHTMKPGEILNRCQQYGEFLQLKIENMSLQHNSITSEPEKEVSVERKSYAVVAAASGEGIKQIFSDRGADVIVDGGQSMNPSAEDFLCAFDKACADTVFVLPNNGNITLTARQAAEIYKKSDVRVIESSTIGEGYAALSMLSYESGDADTIENELRDAMAGVVTAEISKCIRDTEEAKAGEYIGFVGKDILAANESRSEAVCRTVDSLAARGFDICLVLRGKATDEAEAEQIEKYISSHYPEKEVYILDGAQEVYDYILILE